MRIRTQVYEYRIMKEYEYGGTEVAEYFQNEAVAKQTLKEWGGQKEQEDYFGVFRFFLDGGWKTISDSEVTNE